MLTIATTLHPLHKRSVPQDNSISAESQSVSTECQSVPNCPKVSISVPKCPKYRPQSKTEKIKGRVLWGGWVRGERKLRKKSLFELRRRKQVSFSGQSTRQEGAESTCLPLSYTTQMSFNFLFRHLSVSANREGLGRNSSLGTNAGPLMILTD